MKILKPLLNSWKIQDVIEVSISRDNLCKSLPSGKCHHNVAYIQSKFGGHTVLGFLMYDFNDHYWCIPHSIWKNEDSEFIDVTLKDESKILFAPIKIYDSTQAHWFIQNEYRVYKDVSNGIDMFMKSVGTKNMLPHELENMDSSKLVFEREVPLSAMEDWSYYLDELDGKNHDPD
jgi:hypothetical protein